MKSTHLAVLAATSLTVVAMMAGCGKDGKTDSASAGSTAHSATSAAAITKAPNLVGPSAAPLPPPSPTQPPAPAPTPLADVDCGTINGSNGATAHVIAFASAAGRAGCTEAITVASDYVSIPRAADATTVDGWTCEPQPDTGVPHICLNQGLTIGLRGNAGPATPPPPAPTPVRTVDPSQTPAPVHNDEPPAPNPGDTVEDVNCGPVTDAGGGTRTVIAVGTTAGRVGCTEAINVATTYATTISDSDVMTVDGWQCNAQPDATTPSICSKDGLVIGLRAN
ncbi:hypothetical protein [Nocardia australiensis]|uniref:hypothetical protein n=1 Tax=Nocardia australiensis TaxID=2887191 RepID=UPI001D15A5C4|nr:hypothetical protein [Nocardia australiensis]